METAETESLQFLKNKVTEAVSDNLKTISNASVDQAAATGDIVAYVFKDVDPKAASLDHARYDWYYSLLGKGIAIAQGWKINQAPDVKAKGDTGASIQEYLEKTYGQRLQK